MKKARLRTWVLTLAGFCLVDGDPVLASSPTREAPPLLSPFPTAPLRFRMPRCLEAQQDDQTQASGQESNVAVDDLRRRIEDLERRHEDELEDLRVELELMGEPAPSTASGIAGPAGAGNTIMQRLNIFNPTITVFGSFLGRIDDQPVEEGGERLDDRFHLREVELDLRSDLGPWSDGVLILASHADIPGEFETGVEEAFVNIKRLPWLDSAPGGLVLSAGRMRSHFGRLNRLHLHDLPTPRRSLTVQNFLGEEAFAQDGVRGTFFLPSFREESAVQGTVEFLSGGGLPVAAENDGNDLATMSRLTVTNDFGATHQLDLGASYYHGAHDARNRRSSNLVGADVTYAWRPRNMARGFLVSGEVFYGSVDGHAPPGEEDEDHEDEEEDHEDEEEHEEGEGHSHELEGPPRPSSPIGATVLARTQLSQRTFLTVRQDWTELLVDDDEWSQRTGLYLGYQSHEFLRFRLGYEHTRSSLDELDRLNTVLLEITFTFGSHPVHPWWARF